MVKIPTKGVKLKIWGNVELELGNILNRYQKLKINPLIN